MKRKSFYYKGELFNSDFDVLDIETKITPKNIHKLKFKEPFIIKKLCFVFFGPRKKLLAVYVNGNNENVDLQTRMFNSYDIQNKIMDSNIVRFIENKLKESEVDPLFANNISIRNCNGYDFYFYDKELFNTHFDIYEINRKIIPNRIINEYHESSDLKYNREKFIIEKIRIFTYNDRICSVNIDSPHPNADIVDRCFCLPPNLTGQKLNDLSFRVFEEIFKIHNLKNPYFYPQCNE